MDLGKLTLALSTAIALTFLATEVNGASCQPDQYVPGQTCDVFVPPPLPGSSQIFPQPVPIPGPADSVQDLNPNKFCNVVGVCETVTSTNVPSTADQADPFHGPSPIVEHGISNDLGLSYTRNSDGSVYLSPDLRNGSTLQPPAPIPPPANPVPNSNPYQPQVTGFNQQSSDALARRIEALANASSTIPQNPTPQAGPLNLSNDLLMRQLNAFATSTPVPPTPVVRSNPGLGAAGIEQIVRAASYGYPGITLSYRPVGGISLNKAAAERMPLNLDIEGLAYKDGQVVLGGRSSNTTRIDAALFLTALRTACTPYDPYFSLDPVHGELWRIQGSEAMAAVWDRVKQEFVPDGSTRGFVIRTFSVRRDYAALWSELSPQFPELKTRLVFRPEWLRQTRFGEILYKADVLLKELTSGVSVLRPQVPFRGAGIQGYVSSDQRAVARGLLLTHPVNEPPGSRVHRLWFDLMPQAEAASVTLAEDPEKEIDRRNRPELYGILHQEGFVGTRKSAPVQRTSFYTDGGIVDLSAVYPKMFVRRFDYATGKDVQGTDPDYDKLSAHVNEYTERYVHAFEELRDLTDAFRAYVASVQVVKQSRTVCTSIQRQFPRLLDSERVQSPLPEFHPSELFLTVAQYSSAANARAQRLYTYGTSINGGISLRGKEYASVATVERQTPITKELGETLRNGVRAPTWTDDSGRRFLALVVEGRGPVRRAPIIAEESVKN